MTEETRAAAFRASLITRAKAIAARQKQLRGSRTARLALAVAWLPRMIEDDPLGMDGDAGDRPGCQRDDLDGPFLTPTN